MTPRWDEAQWRDVDMHTAGTNGTNPAAVLGHRGRVLVRLRQDGNRGGESSMRWMIAGRPRDGPMRLTA
jgi:hypothetical protein